MSHFQFLTIYFQLSILWFLMSAFQPTKNCLQLKGVVEDYASHSAIGQAQLFSKDSDGNSKAVGQTNENGFFEIEIPCETLNLIIKSKGYRPQNIVLSFAKNNPQLVILIPMVAVDAQASDRPALESEIRQAEQSSSKTDAEHPQKVLFTVIDALTNVPLTGKICLTSTRTKKQQCFDADKAGQVRTQFIEQDIWAMNIQSEGYQSYQGSFVVEKLDGQEQPHEIKMLRELTLVSVQIQADEQLVNLCALREAADSTKTIVLKKVPNTTGWFAAYQLKPNEYQLQITDKNNFVLHQSNFKVNAGLNGKSIGLNPPKKQVTYIEIPDTLSMLYFGQSSYELSTESKTMLDQVAIILKTEPTYQLSLTGYADNTGDERLNRYLSEFRAKVATSYLNRKGIAEDRMTMVGQGSSGAKDAQKTLNRRVHLKFFVK